MKKLSINTDSWHFKFMDFLGTRPDMATDFCAYIRKFIWSVFKSIFFLTVGLLFLIWFYIFLGVFGSFVLFLIGIYPNLNVISTGILVVFLGLVLLIVVLAIVAGTILFFAKLPSMLSESTVSKPKEPGFLKTWYQSVKDKTCNKIKFTSK